MLQVGVTIVYLLLYVNDIILTPSTQDLLWRIMANLHFEVAMIDLGDLHHIHNIFVTHSPEGLFLSQCQYNPIATPVDTRVQLSAIDGALVTNPPILVSRRCLTLTRLDLAYARQ